MSRKRCVFLFGAGAAFDWGGPQTICSRSSLTMLPEHNNPTVIKNRICCLTHLIRATGFKDKDGNRITENIYQQLIKNSPQDAVNFETILNYTEELFSYFGKSEASGFYNDLHFPPSLKEKLINYRITHYPQSSNYRLEVPGHGMYNKLFSSDTSPDQQFVAWLNQDHLGGIVGHVSKYSYDTPSHSELFVSANATINNAFQRWMKTFQDEYYIRIYTLNYDRIFKVLIEGNGIPVFEGFKDAPALIDNETKYFADIEGIQTNINSHCHYNLHGCVNWYMTPVNDNMLPAYQYYLTGVPNVRTASATVEIERGKSLLLSNIISGYQKVQRTAISPFRQMLAAFDKDCIIADKIFIIGYSYGDEHINDIIRNARKFNTACEIILINPVFDDLQFLKSFILHWGKPHGMPYKEKGNNLVCEEFNVHIIKKKFGDFLTGIRECKLNCVIS